MPSAVAYRDVLVPAVLVPDQAAFSDTARLLPVMVPALARASPVGRAAERLIIRAGRSTAYTVPGGGRMKSAGTTWFSSAPAA